MTDLAPEWAMSKAEFSRMQFRDLFEKFEPELLRFADSTVEEFGRRITVKIYCPL